MLNDHDNDHHQGTTLGVSHEPGLDIEFYITGLVYGLTFLVGIIGNTLIVYSVIHFRRMKSLSNVFLASLATADLILIIFCVPVKFVQLFSHTWTFGIFLCKFVHYMQNLCAICSVYTLTAMSIERYYAIIYPVECRSICTMSQTKKVITFVWLGSILLAMPIIWMQNHLRVGEDSYEAFWCVRDWDNKLYWKIYELYMLFIILIIPLIIMTYSYSRICRRLWFVMNQERPNTLFPLSLAAVSNSYQCNNDNETTINNINIDTLNSIESVNYETSMINLNGNNTTTSNTVTTQQSISQQLAPKGSTQTTRKTTTIQEKDHNNSKQSSNVYIDSSYKKMSQVIKMLIVVVVIFVLCWTPILVIQVLTAFELMDKLNYGHMKAIKTSFHLFSYANSCVNPIIYGFMSRNFRASFKAALTRCLGFKSEQKHIII